MKNQKDLPMSISIARVHSADDDDQGCMEVRIFDESSSKRFVTVRISLKDFCNCITGLYNVPCVGEVNGLDKIGKTMEHKDFTFPLGKKKIYGDEGKKIAIKACEKHCPEGWIFEKHFNSQNSFFEKDGKDWARTIIRRWV